MLSFKMFLVFLGCSATPGREHIDTNCFQFWPRFPLFQKCVQKKENPNNLFYLKREHLIQNWKWFVWMCSRPAVADAVSFALRTLEIQKFEHSCYLRFTISHIHDNFDCNCIALCYTHCSNSIVAIHTWTYCNFEFTLRKFKNFAKYVFFVLYFCRIFLASQDAPEGTWVSQWVSEWLLANLTEDSGEWGYWFKVTTSRSPKTSGGDNSEQGQKYWRPLAPMAVMLLRCNRIPVAEFAGWSMVSSRQFARKSWELKLLLHLPLGNLKLPFLQWQLKVVHSQSYLVRPPICDHNFAPCVCDMAGSSFWVRSGW